MQNKVTQNASFDDLSTIPGNDKNAPSAPESDRKTLVNKLRLNVT